MKGAPAPPPPLFLDFCGVLRARCSSEVSGPRIIGRPRAVGAYRRPSFTKTPSRQRPVDLGAEATQYDKSKKRFEATLSRSSATSSRLAERCRGRVHGRRYALNKRRLRDCTSFIASGLRPPSGPHGNPHLAVEELKRRFGFALTRLEVDGAIDLSKLEQALHAPDVIAVYAQSLSYTDGISDDVPRVLDCWKR